MRPSASAAYASAAQAADDVGMAAATLDGSSPASSRATAGSVGSSTGRASRLPNSVMTTVLLSGGRRWLVGQDLVHALKRHVEQLSYVSDGDVTRGQFGHDSCTPY